MNGSYFWNPKQDDGLLTSNDSKVAPPTSDLSIQGGYTQSNATSIGVNWIPSSPSCCSAPATATSTSTTRATPTARTTRRSTVYVTPSSAAGLPVPAQWQQSADYTNVADPFQTQYDRLTRHNVYFDATTSRPSAARTTRSRAATRSTASPTTCRATTRRVTSASSGVRTSIARSIVDARGTYGYYIWEDGVRLNSAVNSRNHGFYVQDTWQVNPRLTINAGVRFENEYLPPFRAEQDGVPGGQPDLVRLGRQDRAALRRRVGRARHAASGSCRAATCASTTC